MHAQSKVQSQGWLSAIMGMLVPLNLVDGKLCIVINLTQVLISIKSHLDFLILTQMP